VDPLEPLRRSCDQVRQPTDQDWTDTWFLALGLTWKPDDEWTLRGGAAWDQDPTKDRRRTPRLPTDDRYWLSVGGGWKPLENLVLDLSYTHVFFADASIDLTRSQPGNAARGDLSGTAQGNVDIIAVQAKWMF
jgi:long-chain fatty acid transport protein